MTTRPRLSEFVGAKLWWHAVQLKPPSTWAPVLFKTGLGAAGRDPLFPNNNSGLLAIVRTTYNLKVVGVIRFALVIGPSRGSLWLRLRLSLGLRRSNSDKGVRLCLQGADLCGYRYVAALKRLWHNYIDLI